MTGRLLKLAEFRAYANGKAARVTRFKLSIDDAIHLADELGLMTGRSPISLFEAMQMGYVHILGARIQVAMPHRMTE